MALNLNIQLDDALFDRIRTEAERRGQAINTVIEIALDRQISKNVRLEEELPPSLRAELAAMSDLSDDILWHIAKLTFEDGELEELDLLLETRKLETLSEEAEERCQFLMSKRDGIILKRGQAAVILKDRGYNMSDPRALQKK